MGRFNILQYRPKDDSTPGVLPKGTDPKTTLILEHTDPANCPCGCNQPPRSKGRTFGMGHDARLRGKLIRAHLSGTPVCYATLAPNGKDYVAKTTQDALFVAQGFGWKDYLLDAEHKQGPSIAAKLAKANGEVLAAATGPQIGDRKVVKVGRWSYTGQLMAVYANGDADEFEVEYVDKKGGKHRVRVPQAKLQDIA